MMFAKGLVSIGALSLTGCASLFSQGQGGSESSKPESAVSLSPGDSGYLDPGPWEGPLHQKYAGQVVFSSKPIPKDGADDSSVYKDYPLGEPLFIRFWARESPHNLLPKCKRDHRYIVRVDVNGENAGKPGSKLPSIKIFSLGDDKTRGMTSLSGKLEVPFTTPAVWPPPRDDGDEVMGKFTSLAIPKLKDGDNTIRFLIDMDCGASKPDNPVVAEGTLRVKVKPGAREDYLAKYGLHLAPSKHPENDKLAPEIKALVGGMRDWDNEVVLGARVLSSEWQPVRNKLTGVLTHFVAEAAIVVRLKKEANENACRIFPIGIERDAAGGGIRWGGNGSGSPFSCMHAPK